MVYAIATAASFGAVENALKPDHSAFVATYKVVFAYALALGFSRNDAKELAFATAKIGSTKATILHDQRSAGGQVSIEEALIPKEGEAEWSDDFRAHVASCKALLDRARSTEERHVFLELLVNECVVRGKPIPAVLREEIARRERRAPGAANARQSRWAGHVIKNKELYDRAMRIHHLQERSWREIAECLEISPNRLARIRRQFSGDDTRD